MENKSIKTDRHLDIGCGPCPGNPYGRTELFGIDIRELPETRGFTYIQTNLTVNPIPFPDNYFASVSAFDYLEHVPRIILNEDGRDTAFPFVQLMSEIWRVLEPGGRLYAITPLFPHPAAFTDPTHVNIITEDTHGYFCGDSPKGMMYGFKGRFTPLRTEYVIKKDALMAKNPSFIQHIKRVRYKIQGRLFHFLWELEARK